jgi:pimeloyl-ACP methyl ester carboxylesterase
MDDPRFFTAADGTRLAYRDEGAGMPLIALAGLTRHGGDFDFVAPHLQDVRLIRPDYRGRGASDNADWQTYTVAQEAADVLALLDHLGIERAAFLGTSRGGLVAMALAASVKGRLIGVCLNDVGPVIDAAGLAGIEAFIGRNPSAKTFEAAAAARARMAVGFSDVPEGRWLADVKNLFRASGDGLVVNYDPALRDAFLAGYVPGEPVDVWPLFDALEGLPLALIHGAGSDLLSAATVTEMRKRRPDMLYAPVPGRGHVPWLDEPEAVAAITTWLEACR